MSDHNRTPDLVTQHPEQIPGYDYGSDRAARSPLTLEDLERLKEAVWFTGLRHTSAKKTKTDNADSLDQIPMRYLLAEPRLARRGQHGYDDHDG
ncbi:MAG: hypothetical protein ACRDRO_24175 [Pseudonocardiaceae bacterium]